MGQLNLIQKFMQNNNLEGWVEVNIKSRNKGTIVLVSFDEQGQMVMKEMSALGYFFFKAGKNKNTKKHKVLFTVISIFLLVMFADDFIRSAKKFPAKFVHAFEVSRACDNNVSVCQYNSRIN